MVSLEAFLFPAYLGSKRTMSAQSGLYGRVLGNVSYLTLGRVINAICSFGYIAFAIRSLGLRNFGVLILIHSLALAASTLTRMQSWQTLIHFGDPAFKSGDRLHLAQIVGFCIRLDLISACAALVVTVASVFIYGLTSSWSAQELSLAYAYACFGPFLYTGWAQGVLRLTGRFKLVPIIDATTALFRTAGAALGLLGHCALPFFVMVWAATILLGYILTVCLALRVLRDRLQMCLNLRQILSNWRWRIDGMWSFTRATSLNQTLSLVSGSLSTLIVGSLLGPAEAAIFRVCRQIADGIVTPAQLLTPVLYPELTRLRAEGRLRDLAQVTWKIFAILSVASFALLVVAATIGGKVFSVMLHMHISGSTGYITIMMVAAAFNLLIVPLEPMLIIMGQVSRLVKARSFALILYFPALVLLTMHYRLTGACVATALLGFLILAYWVWSAHRCSRRARLEQHATEQS